MSESSGLDILKNPRLNKGTAFSKEERENLGLVGLLPPHVSTMDQQVQRHMFILNSKPSDMARYMYLASLQKRNERLYYKLLLEHTQELMPIVYTPTVGQACEEFAVNFREAQGFYASIEDRGHVADILNNWPEDDVRLIVVTDGERILGLGDLGANGMGIPIGKLALYCALAGVDPAKCLPVTLDVGTDNASLLDDPHYMGLRRNRVRGEEYDSFIDEFIQAVKARFPNVLLQFEDFATNNAVSLLERYRNELLSFNDDIQGTAAVAVAGLIASTRITNKKLSEQTYLFLGAGSASTGIGALLVNAMVKEGLSEQAARDKMFYVNSRGLVTTSQTDRAGPHLSPFIKDMPDMDFAAALKAVNPDVLIGASGQPRVFTQEVVEHMSREHDHPVIFALSNPTSKAECTAEEAYQWSEGKAVFASGSPFDPVEINGMMKVPGQGNNAYIFPGLGLGALHAGVTRISDEMLLTSAEALADCVSEARIELGCLYPQLSDIRDVSLKIAVAVSEKAEALGDVKAPLPENLEQLIREAMYDPTY
jgi:malate dehydrogenase (oxaloacetate-decarboxylating)(NADP+)